MHFQPMTKVEDSRFVGIRILTGIDAGKYALRQTRQPVRSFHFHQCRADFARLMVHTP